MPGVAEQRTGRRGLGVRSDLLAVGVAAVLVGLAAVVGERLNRPGSGVAIHALAPPVYAGWYPHTGPGSAAAVLLAVAVIVWGPVLAGRLRWPGLLGLGYLTAVGWTLSLGMVDGWRPGLAGRLADSHEYLHEVGGITDIGAMVRTFADRIPLGVPGSWTTHVAGHPPGATLIFVWLDRLGFPGGGYAAMACVLGGCLAAVAVPVTVWMLGSDALARGVLPFAVLFPGAVWVGASADGLFAGLTSVGIALLAIGVRRARWCCVPGGVLLGFGVFCSYGLVLLGVIALAVLLVARDWRALALAVSGELGVLLAFSLAGFWWFEGYQNLVQRYYQGIGGERPYWYWVWANVACLVLATGPAVAAGLRRAFQQLAAPTRQLPVLAVVFAAVLAVLLADLSGLSKAEVERIWLPFAVWLIPAAGLLPEPARRWGLAGQALTALAVNHLLWTNW